MIGLLGSYRLGFDPSRIPPWGVARRAPDDAEAEAEAAAVTLTVFVTTEAATEDMVGVGVGVVVCDCGVAPAVSMLLSRATRRGSASDFRGVNL
jgi:hypothetical protein